MQDKENTEKYSEAQLKKFVKAINDPTSDPLPIVVGSVAHNMGGKKPDLKDEYNKIQETIKDIKNDQDLSLEEQKTILDCISDVVSKLETQNSKKVGLIFNNFDNNSIKNIENARNKVNASLIDINSKLKEEKEKKEKEEKEKKEKEEKEKKDKEEKEKKEKEEKEKKDKEEKEKKDKEEQQKKEEQKKATDIKEYKTGQQIYNMYNDDPANFKENLRIAIFEKFSEIAKEKPVYDDKEPQRTEFGHRSSNKATALILDHNKASEIATKIHEKLEACFKNQSHLADGKIPDFQTENLLVPLGRLLMTLLAHIFHGKDNSYQQEYELKDAEDKVNKIINENIKGIMSL